MLKKQIAKKNGPAARKAIQDAMIMPKKASKIKIADPSNPNLPKFSELTNCFTREQVGQRNRLDAIFFQFIDRIEGEREFARFVIRQFAVPPEEYGGDTYPGIYVFNADRSNLTLAVDFGTDCEDPRSGFPGSLDCPWGQQVRWDWLVEELF